MTINNKYSLQANAYNSIKNQIITKNLVPNTLYSETKLSTDLGISRTPLREALRRLAQDGYITIMPSKGFMLRQLTKKDMLETIQMRCAIEGFCTHVIAGEIDTKKAKSLLSKLGKLIKTMEVSRQFKSTNKNFIKADHEFHLTIIAYLNNAEFEKVFQRLMYLIDLTTSNALSVPGRLNTTLAEHQQYLLYLKKGDGDMAYSIMIKHLMMPLNLHMV